MLGVKQRCTTIHSKKGGGGGHGNTPSHFVTNIVAHSIPCIGTDYMCFVIVRKNKTVDLPLFSKSDSTNTSPYARFMQGQKATNAYSVAGQRAPSYGHTASRRRPPAIPVRSRVATGQTLRPQPLVTAHHLLAGMLIVGVKTMKGFFFDNLLHPIKSS